MKIKIKRGLDLPIEGHIDTDTTKTIVPTNVAIYPDDFHGFKPKVDVKVGDPVKIGTVLMHDKDDSLLTLTSPVSGHILDIERGERRKLIRVVIANDGLNTHETLLDDPESSQSRLDRLALSGLLAYIERRPYAVVARPGDNPRDIFVTAFDSAPLAPLTNYTHAKEFLKAGVEALAMMTPGKIYISRRSVEQVPDIPGAVMVDVKGPHPAGNVGVQIANIAPLNKGENVWTLSADTLIRIGELANTGRLNYNTTVALTGSRLTRRMKVNTIVGAPVAELLAGCFDDDPRHRRIISGNVLTGQKVELEGYLHFPYKHITVIPEGDDIDEFMGWASLSPSKMSINPSFPGHFLHRLFNPDARILGGRRAMIMSGLIDRVLPMDIMGEYLVKAAHSHDVDAMEQLGIYEIAPEDFALAECIDSSKVPYQAIMREALDYLRHEVE